MLNVSFYIFTMSMLNVSLDKCKVAMEVGLGVVLCFEVLSRMTLRLWTSAELWTSTEGFCGRLRDEGCSVLVCPGAKFCSWLQSFALRGIAGTGGSRVRRR